MQYLKQSISCSNLHQLEDCYPVQRRGGRQRCTIGASLLCPWTTYTHSANSTVTLGTDARRPGRTRREDRLSNQVEGVVVLFAVEPLVVQGLKGPFSDAVMARSLDPGADVRN